MNKSGRGSSAPWTLNDFQGNLTLVFRTDGTFSRSACEQWRGGLKRLFEGDTTTSRGDVGATATAFSNALVTSTMDPKLLSRNYHYWIQSVGDTSLVAKNLFGGNPHRTPASLIAPICASPMA